MRWRRRGQRSAPSWNREQMLSLLIGGFFVAVALLVGFVLVLIAAAAPSHHRNEAKAGQAGGAGPAAVGSAATATAAAGVASVDPVSALNALAARAMPQVDQTAAQPAAVSTRDPGAPLVVPESTTTGPTGVPSGYPHTAEGALAQMASIDQTAMQSGSLPGVRAVIRSWAAPGGPTASSWSGVAAMAALLDSTHLSGGGSAQLTLVVTPLMGLVKGTVGADAAVTCVDFEFDATLAQTARVAEADCERMVWTDGHWLIGAGAEPAPPPSVWPDTDTALAVGYRDLRHG